MNATKQPLITMFFNRGAFVTWKEGDELTLSVTNRHGIVECESTQRPGWFFVRNEHGDLDLLNWAELTLADRKGM